MKLAGYAKIKVDMNQYIDGMLNKSPQGIEENFIFLQVDNLFGMGKLTVTRRLDLLTECGKIVRQDGMVKSVKNKKEVDSDAKQNVDNSGQ